MALPQGWLTDAEWSWAQQHLPIACVDLVAIETTNNAETRFGLIYRKAPTEQMMGWCLIGGRVLKGETLHSELARHVTESLGDAIHLSVSPDAQPAYVAQYPHSTETNGPHDPRQQAIASTFVGHLHGEPAAMGEAEDFQWFTKHETQELVWGFGQRAVFEAAWARHLTLYKEV